MQITEAPDKNLAKLIPAMYYSFGLDRMPSAVNYNDDDDNLGLWLPLGILLGMALAFLGFLILEGSKNVDWASRYDGIIGALLAVSAAFVSVMMVRRQIQQTYKIESSRRNDVHRAARSMLPFALSKLASYSRDTISKLAALLPDGDEEDGYLRPPIASLQLPQLPQLPFEALEVVKENIESAPTEIAKVLGELVSDAQIYNSRLHGFAEKVLEKDSIGGVHYLLDAHEARKRIMEFLEFHARVVKCFDYGRSRSNYIEAGILSSDMANAAMVCEIHDTGYPTIWHIIGTSYKKPEE